MLVRNVVLGVVALVVLTGCSTIAEKRQVDYKAGAVQTPPLEVPPDLTVPEAEQRYTIPGTDGEKVASYSEYTKQTAEQPCVAPAAVPAAAKAEPAPVAKLQEVDNVQTILLSEPFDRGWRRIGLAMERAGIVATDKDRANGIYFIAAPGKSKKKPRDYQITVHETATGCTVAVNNGDGESNQDTKRLTETLFKNLEQ